MGAAAASEGHRADRMQTACGASARLVRGGACVNLSEWFSVPREVVAFGGVCVLARLESSCLGREDPTTRWRIGRVSGHGAQQRKCTMRNVAAGAGGVDGGAIRHSRTRGIRNA